MFLRPGRRVQKAAAGFDVAVAEDDMGVWIPVGFVLLVEFEMQREVPWHPVLRHLAAKLFDNLDALLRRQLPRQPADKAVRHASVLALPLLLHVKPRLGFFRTWRNDMAAD